MTGRHSYAVEVTWTGNRGRGTAAYSAYERSHEIAAAGKPTLAGSSDPMFRGDAARWNPEELLVGALAACHQLAYLHLCADAGVVVTGYVDRATGGMAGGRFVEVVLHPAVTLAAGSDAATAAKAQALHEHAHADCFIARSVNFAVRHEPTVRIESE